MVNDLIVCLFERHILRNSGWAGVIIHDMDYIVRNIRDSERPLLEEFLYQAIWVPEDFEGEVPRSVVRDDPKCCAAYLGFGSLPDDRALVAEADGELVGSCWVRTTDEYGHIDDATPSFSISLYPAYRGRGIGTSLMRRMLTDLEDAGYARCSLSVQKENPALHLYERLGFCIVGSGADATEWLMVHALNEPFVVLESDSLILRPWLLSDASALFALASDPSVGPSAGWPPHGSVEDSAGIIKEVLSAPKTYAVVLKATGELVGCAGFNAGDAANMPLKDGELELGYWIGKPFWGRGYATEAARAVVERGFSELGLSGIHSAYYDGNEKSKHVLDKLGFAYVRTEIDVPCRLLGETRTEHFAYLDADALSLE